MGERPDGFTSIERLRAVAGHIAEVAEHLRAIDRWVEDGNARPLEAYLALPNTAARRRRYRRDKWLTRAARQLDAPGPWSLAQALKEELDMFASRGPWLAWRDDGAPPEGASELRTALFYAMRFNGGDDLSVRTLFEVVRSVSTEKLRATSPTVDAPEDERCKLICK